MGPSETGNGERRAWHRLTVAEQNALTTPGQQRIWQSGEFLAMQGSPPSSMFVIIRGWVKITATNYRGDNAPLAARGPGEIVGELAPISGLPRGATIQAMDEVCAWVITAERLLAVLSRNPRIAMELLRSLAFRLQQSDRLRLESGGTEFPQRLAALLLELALQYDPDWAAASEVVLHQTQEDLASFARVSRSTLIRGLDELKRIGVVKTARHRVTIIRPDILRDLAAGRPAP
ncbi:MAG TPA: Crp/Fnr family transcriptional regulator [Actinophytocola sp.]|jgi:CRP-like cAMP-binding protein|uniref:Crp/Fnr family transcriptional regulator n=1 Tax=Actinophytocola sp. TaxID=1872138 RepID=UPI002F931B51